MLEVVHSSEHPSAFLRDLSEHLSASNIVGILYLGFPYVHAGGKLHQLDALLVTSHPAVMAILDSSKMAEGPTPDEVYIAIRQRLEKNFDLRDGRNLRFPFESFAFDSVKAVEEALGKLLDGVETTNRDLFESIESTLESLVQLRTKSRIHEYQNPTSLGAKLARVDQEIRTLDQAQRRATISATDRPERIRGLAGTGKTIVIALRAALLHSLYPDWNICVTFYTRSLYRQFESLIERFCFTYEIEPNWERLQIRHAWGASDRPGFYRDLAKQVGFPPISLDEAKGNSNNPFAYICQKFSSYIKGSKGGHIKPTYDAVLIDEAQDLPPSFFELVYFATKEPKRIVYAYDELQNLTGSALPDPSGLFGESPNGQPNISDAAVRNTILYKSYRNTPQVLVGAHALGFGVYRDEGLIQNFPDEQTWEAVGYEKIAGSYIADHDVTLRRKAQATPEYMIREFPGNTPLSFHQVPSKEDQALRVAAEIERLLDIEELRPEDILVIFPDPYYSKSDSVPVMQACLDKGIFCHFVGAGPDKETVYQEGSVACISTFRAKGNECKVALIANAERCARGDLIRLRNMLFAAMTRSRGPVTIFGIGDGMKVLVDELDKVRANEYTLSFTVLTEEENQRRRMLYREKTKEERLTIDRALSITSELKELLATGFVKRDDLDLDEL